MSERSTTYTETQGNSPGAVLKRCREYHEITLEEASESTKIGITHLKSLEDDNFTGFANLTYLKGFLRIYATYLGLNPDDMARMYDKIYNIKDANNNQITSSSENRTKPRRIFSLRNLALPAFLLLLIVISAFFMNRSTTSVIRRPILSHAPSPPPKSTPSALSTPVQQALSSAKPVNTATANVTVKEVTPNVSDNADSNKASPQQLKAFILRIKVTQNGRLNAVVDGSSPQFYELSAGDIIEWKAVKNVALDLSNAGGVDVELNGKPLKSLGAPGKPAYIVFNADGVKQ